MTTWGQPRASRLTGRGVALALAEVLGAVGVATGAVALLESVASPGGLGIVYLLAVLLIAIRRGGTAALVTAVLGVFTLNYLFIPPRHRLAIAHSQDVVELAVLLIAGLVVARLATLARERAAEAESRARLAARREREATLLADVASAILAGDSVEAQLRSAGRQLAQALQVGSARVAVESAASPDSARRDGAAPREGERAVKLPSRGDDLWLYLQEAQVDESFLERMARPVGSLIEVAIERERIAQGAAESEASRRAEVAKTAVLHAISHDLRSPITAITTAGAALNLPGLSELERSELIGSVTTESTRLAKMVDDLLDVSKIEAGAVAPQDDWCDLADVVALAARRFEPLRAIELELPSHLPLVRADATQLERVFANLIENALKFSAAEDPVRITGGASAGWVTVRVIDQGSGIPREDRLHIFEPFYRGRGAAAAGSGLGLAICRGFVEANGGRILVQPGLQRGTAFAVSFPRAAEPAGVPEPAAR